jgi:serine/threonine protein kinase/tetratricopeptide (TPR) repeat protein
MPHSEHGSRSVAARGAAVANPPLHARISLRNGLCATTLFRDAAQLGVFGSRRETFQRALVAAAKFRAQLRFPGYEILDEVGRGGMGVIYRAREVRGGRVVALKCLLPADATSDALLSRFRREAETSAKLNHSNIVPVYHIGESVEGLPFFAMQFAAGGNLDQARDKYRANTRGTVGLVRDVALAVQYAHDEGILHRDLKPSNILLDERGEPLVGDFGLARLLNDSSHLTRTCALFGTLPYMAPEQLTGSPATAAGDIYSLGVVLFELLTQTTPPADDSLRSGKPARNCAEQAIDRDLQTICAHCLEALPSDRYVSCGALASDLDSWLRDGPISIRRVNIVTRLGRRFRNNPKWLAILCTCLVSVCAIIIWQTHVWKIQRTAYSTILADHSVGVMAFVSLDRLESDTVFGGLLADLLLQELKLNGSAQVQLISPTNSRALRADEIVKQGRSANTRTVLTGTLRTVGDRQRASIRLLDCATGDLLFVRSWEGDRSGAPANVAKTIAPSVYKLLDSTRSGGAGLFKSDPILQHAHAREAIAAGRDLMFRYRTGDLDQAIALFKEAVAEVPSSALAHSFLASAATVRTHYIADWSFLTLAREEAVKAVQLAPSLGDAHRALAGVYYQEGRFDAALEEAMKTVEMSGFEENTVRFIGMIFDTLGRLDHALNWFGLASEVGGNAADVEAHIGDCWVKLGDDERALLAYTRAEELEPNHAQGMVGICHAKMLQGDFASARKIYSSRYWHRDDLGQAKAAAAQIELFSRNFEAAANLYADLTNTDQDGGGTFYGCVSYQSALGRAKQHLGDWQGATNILQQCLAVEALAVSHQPENPEAFYRLAAVEACLGKLDDATGHLQTAIKLGWIDYRSLVMDPRFDAIRPKAAFPKIVNALSVKVAGMKKNIKQ